VISVYPELPFLTKHDSLLPVEIKLNGNKVDFEKLVAGTIEQVLGIKPTLKLKCPKALSDISSTLSSNMYSYSLSSTTLSTSCCSSPFPTSSFPSLLSPFTLSSPLCLPKPCNVFKMNKYN
jgi:hypothetical protein